MRSKSDGSNPSSYPFQTEPIGVEILETKAAVEGLGRYIVRDHLQIRMAGALADPFLQDADTDGAGQVLPAVEGIYMDGI